LPSLTDLDKQHLWHPFTPMQAWCDPAHEPLVIVEGEGCTLRDEQGREYLDGNASIWTNIHGHAHPVLNAAITAQLQRVAHVSFLGLTHEPAVRLAAELLALFPGEKLTRVFYSDNGSTAIEAGVRMALQYWQQNGAPQRSGILAFDHAYHGDTLGAASLGGLSVFKGSANDFGYAVQRVASLEALQGLPSETLARAAAVIIEPLIQGAAGMKTWPAGMLRELQEWCREHDIFLILDEVMTAFGRTGKMFACEHEGVVPDILCMAKGLTGGYLPMAATLATERLFNGFLGQVAERRTFYYGHSYTGNPLGCAAALASLQIFREERVLDGLPAKIATLARCLDSLREHPHVSEIRQCGLIAGIDLVRRREPRVCFDFAEQVGARVCMAARQHGLITRPVVDTLVLLPPLCVTEAELVRMVEALRRGIADVMQRG
jgi:adenosylmethionine-8-amino-7-oxononanoate aminotransferase